MGKNPDDMGGNKLSVGKKVMCRDHRGVHTFKISRIDGDTVYDGPSPYMAYKCIRKDKFKNLSGEDMVFFHQRYETNKYGRNNDVTGASRYEATHRSRIFNENENENEPEYTTSGATPYSLFRYRERFRGEERGGGRRTRRRKNKRGTRRR